VQGERELVASEDEISALVERYHAWLGRALNVLPPEYEERFRAEYNGSWHSHKIKHFFEAPGEVSLLGRGTDDDTPSPFPTGSTRTTRRSEDLCLRSGRF
jgi:hypothetical protein